SAAEYSLVPELDAEDAAKKKKKKASGKKGKGAQQAECKTGLRPRVSMRNYAEADDELTPDNSKGWDNESSESDEDAAERLLGEKPEADSDSEASIADSDSDSTDADSDTCSERAVEDSLLAKPDAEDAAEKGEGEPEQNQIMNRLEEMLSNLVENQNKARTKINVTGKSTRRANEHLTNLAGQEAQFEGSQTKKIKLKMPGSGKHITEVTLVEVWRHQKRQQATLNRLQEAMESWRTQSKLEVVGARKIRRLMKDVKKGVTASIEVLQKKMETMESAVLQISHNRELISDLAIEVGHNRELITDLAVKVGNNTDALAQLSRGQDPAPAPSGASAPATAPAPAPLVPAASRRRAGFGA
ncbi:hypothetical protein TeGR_g12947, partial [Tetraparma gracilis]